MAWTDGNGVRMPRGRTRWVDAFAAKSLVSSGCKALFTRQRGKETGGEWGRPARGNAMGSVQEFKVNEQLKPSDSW